MATKPKPPVKSGTPADPTGLDALERSAMQAFRVRLARIRREYVASIDLFKPTLAVNAKYAYRLDQITLNAVLSGLDSYVDSVLLDGGQNQLWFFDEFVNVAYERGTLQEFVNLSRQSPTYRTARESMLQLIRSEPYQTRIALIRAREFEEMKGLSGNVKADMSRVLTDGLARGLPPNEVAANLKQQTGIEINRANRIARSEIPTALRRARMDEADDARESMGLRTLEMHLSALSPTTRVTHAQRHGKLFTTDQQRQWWSEGANSINCYVPGTRVQGRFIAGSKAFYRGPVIKMVTASGRDLTVTPNHPILTATGMKPAVSLRKGDYAIAYGVQIENPTGVGALDDKQVHPSVQDVFASLVQVGHSFSRRVDAVDFHGDAAMMNVDIEVVRAERFLPRDDQATIGQCLDGLRFVLSDAAVAHDFGALHSNGEAINPTTPSIVGGTGQCEALRGCAIRGPQDGALAAPSFGGAVIAQDAVNGRPRDAESERKGLCAAPVGVFADEVVFVDVLEFCGHVYDLEEKSGLMVANGIIASNCKCTTISVMVDSDGEPLIPDFVENARASFKQQAEKEGMPWAKDL